MENMDNYMETVGNCDYIGVIGTFFDSPWFRSSCKKLDSVFRGK